MFETLLAGIRSIHDHVDGQIPLHAPWFDADDEAAVVECVRSSFVSSVGPEIVAFERDLCERTGCSAAVAVVNGTAALHTALLMADVGTNDLVITQALTFIATCNAIRYTGAQPVFIDVDADTLGLSPEAVKRWLEEQCEMHDGKCRHRDTGRWVKACIPMHTFGMVMRITELLNLCEEWRITVIEDAAEALGSSRNGRHAGTFAPIGTLSFNGNKVITCGGGGDVLFKSIELAAQAKHLTTQAKVPHPWSFAHDRTGYNYRMPNLNAALARSQLRKLDHNLAAKRELHHRYSHLLASTPWTLVGDPSGTISNHWLNAILFRDREERDAFLEAANNVGIQCRPAWELATDLPMYQQALQAPLPMSRSIQDRLVNIPSSAHP